MTFDGVGPNRATNQTHQRCRAQIVPLDITHDKADRRPSERYDVVPVTAYGGGGIAGQIARGDRQPGTCGRFLGSRLRWSSAMLRCSAERSRTRASA